MYSALVPEVTCTEATYAWVFVENPGGLKGSGFVLTKLYLMMLQEKILKASYASTNIELIWRGKCFVVPNYRIQDYLTLL